MRMDVTYPVSGSNSRLIFALRIAYISRKGRATPLTMIFTADAARLYKNYARFDLSSDYRTIDPPYPPADADSSPIDEFAAKHPRAAATLGSFFSFPALVCYIAYTAAVFIDL